MRCATVQHASVSDDGAGVAVGVLHNKFSYADDFSGDGLIGIDPANTPYHFAVAYGGSDMVTKDGKLNSKDPKARKGVSRAMDELAKTKCPQRGKNGTTQRYACSAALRREPHAQADPI
jgi:hypothetical protein